MAMRVVRRFLTIGAGIARVVARASSYAVLAFVVVATLRTAGPHGSHWSFEKHLAWTVFQLSTSAILASLLLTAIAGLLTPWCENRQARPLWPAVLCNIVSIAVVHALTRL